jgi:hypothetical protein
MVAATGSFEGEADGSGKRTYFKERIWDGTKSGRSAGCLIAHRPHQPTDPVTLTRKNPLAPKAYKNTEVENILPKFRNEARMVTMILDNPKVQRESASNEKTL